MTHLITYLISLTRCRGAFAPKNTRGGYEINDRVLLDPCYPKNNVEELNVEIFNGGLICKNCQKKIYIFSGEFQCKIRHFY